MESQKPDKSRLRDSESLLIILGEILWQRNNSQQHMMKKH